MGDRGGTRSTDSSGKLESLGGENDYDMLLRCGYVLSAVCGIIFWGKTEFHNLPGDRI